MAHPSLLARATQALAAVGMAAALVAPLPAQAQYAVSDSQLTSSVRQAFQQSSTIAPLGIQVSASQGVVTLTGNVPDEEDRTEAEQAAGGVDGVRSIQDNLMVNGAPATARQPATTARSEQATVPAPGAQAPAASGDNGMPPPPPTAEGDNNGMPPPPPAAEGNNAGMPPPAAEADHAGMPPPPPADQAAQNTYGNQQGPPQGAGYPQQDGWGERGNAHVPAQYNALGVSPQQQNASGPVTMPAGSLLSVRISQPLSTGAVKAGQYFQATAASDVYANGVLAVPRGAVLTGVVVESKNAGPFGGRPKLDLRLTSIQLGPNTYPLRSQVWTSEGASKTGYTAANTAGGAIFGALIGAVAGGGVGAGVGALAGGAGGAAISGATHGPRLDLPPEALLDFHLDQPLTVKPVSFDQAQQLVNSAPQAPRLMRRRPYYAPPPYPMVYGAPYPY